MDQIKKCEVCRTTEDVRKVPLMTGVPFNSPDHEQRYVCIKCFSAWHEDGCTTAEQILAARGLPSPINEEPGQGNLLLAVFYASCVMLPFYAALWWFWLRHAG